MSNEDGTAAAGHLQLEPFEPASGSWTEWEERLQFFLESNGITSDSRKRATFLTVCGKQTYSLVRSLVSPSKPGEVSFKDLLEKIKEHQDPKPSVLVSRFKFGTCNRRPGQAVADYVAALRKASEHCCFEDTLEDRLLEQLVIGVGDERMQRRLLSEKSLDFSNAVRICLALETSTKDAHLMSHNGERAEPVQAVSAGSRREQQAHPQCWRCTGDNHSADVCRFRNSKCYNCHGLGHVSKACPKPRRTGAGRGRPPAGRGRGRRQVTNAVSASDTEDWDNWPDEDAGNVQQVAATSSDSPQSASVLQVSSPPLRCSVYFQRTQVDMEIDTGSGNTLIGEDTYKSLRIRPRLKPSALRLRTYTGDVISVLGEFRTAVTYKGQKHANLKVVVVQGNRTSLLGRDWLKAVKLDWKEVCAVENVSVAALRRKYAEVFEPGLGELKDVKLRLNIDRSVQPKFFRARSMPYAYKEKVEKQLQKDVESGVLEQVTHSRWAAPLVPVLKKDGTVRVCANLKLTANKAVKCDTYPLPRAQDIFAQLAGGRVFTTLDLAQAYNQVIVHEDSRDVLTVNTPKGLMRYSRLPFGLNSAVSLFQREIERVLRDLPGVVAYLDDILISSRTTEEHLKTLDDVLGRLKRAGLKVRPAKCRFLVPSVEYLGHIVDKDGIRPTPAKVRAIQSAPEPKNVKQLKSFLGILTYYSRYIPDRSQKLAPLHLLLQKDVAWRWGAEQAASFQWARDVLSSGSVLGHFDINKRQVLVCDASSVGIGAVLAQREADGTEKPVGFVSRSLSPCERKYSQIEREALAIVFGVTKFHAYLAGNMFSLVTDHKPLVMLFGEHADLPEMASSRIRRWALKLSTYRYEIQYRRTEEMGNADALSRCPLPDSNSSQEEDLVLLVDDQQLFDARKVALLTSRDPVLSRVMRLVQRGGWPQVTDADLSPFASKRLELSVCRGVLMWGHRVVVPSRAREAVLKELHVAHPGIRRMKALARGCVWWPQLDQHIEHIVNSCQACQESRPAPGRSPICMWPWPERAWSRIHVDFAEPKKGSVSPRTAQLP
ncbi:uncharacterized protein K02A2.6-like isoform X1 [Amphibalanus amphitrite]|uniref:uncharacterized protein K02A2.6-like isoform X1 n=1 Tax=Amphibalanus amphitrite TaxID=1232801 RepID=UPI001C918BA6|nr:uncharacterized protein K02A2.6-like isoform X1 [Amphibalanus amphitrite]XP_043192223.1 uncharacterized protein K02A2.6-like isoform X1 [Amphibalanus amphitrite]